MIKFNNKKRASQFNFIVSIVLILVFPILVSFLIHGAKLFSSFSYFMDFTPLGWAYGFAFALGHKLISIYTEKLDWNKNLKRANVISLSMYIIYGIIVSISVPYLYDRYVWGMSGDDLFIDVAIKALMGFSLDFAFIAIYYSTYLTKYWKKAIENNEELKRENLQAKYQALKNQVNPHFLFNSLNTLTGVVEQRPEQSTAFIKKLSDIYRYVLEQSEQEMVSIDKEMKFVEDYIFLLKMRFEDALIFDTDLKSKNNIKVAPLGVQMLVENAIKHNIISDEMPLQIKIYTKGDKLIVSNNLQKKKTVIAKNEPLGLENLKKRYSYLSNSSVEIISSGKDFIVKLPIIESGEK